MASVIHPTPTRWVVHLASQSDSDSEVTVELRMSKATADNLAHVECSRIAGLNPGQTDLPAEDVGSAVLGIVASVGAINRVKERAAALDQKELMDVIDREADAARAGRP